MLPLHHIGLHSNIVPMMILFWHIQRFLLSVYYRITYSLIFQSSIKFIRILFFFVKYQVLPLFFHLFVYWTPGTYLPTSLLHSTTLTIRIESNKYCTGMENGLYSEYVLQPPPQKKRTNYSNCFLVKYYSTTIHLLVIYNQPAVSIFQNLDVGPTYR